MAENITRLSPRQKMINLMYIVLTAMLALNVSSDVLDGFTQVHEGLNRSNTNFDNRNASILRQLRTLAEMNPDKGGVWYDRAASVRARTAALYDLVDSLKLTIVREADGDDGDVDDIRRRDDLEAAAGGMLSATFDGPMLPATNIRLPPVEAASASARAMRAPARLISSTLPDRERSDSEIALALKVFVSMISAPASIYSRWMRAISSG